MSNENYLAIFYNSASISVSSSYDEADVSAAFATKSYSRTLQTAFPEHDVSFCSPEQMSVLSGVGDILSPLYDYDLNFSKDSGILPPGLLYADSSYLIFERPPMYQNISVIFRMMDDIDYSRNEIITYRIPIPWHVYIVNIVDNPDADGKSQYYPANVRMLFTHGPIQSLNDPVYLPPLLNFYSNGDLCRPMYYDIEDIERYPKTISGVIQSSFDWIWNTGTNIDLTNAIAQYYFQFKFSYNDRLTVFQDEDDIKEAYSLSKFFHFQNYYCNPPMIQQFFQAWEKLTLDQVIHLNWPNPSVTRSMRSEIEQLYSEDLMEYVRETGQVSEEDMHYDSDEQVFYQCGENGCRCMGSDDIDLNDFMKWAQIGPYRQATLSISLREFAHQCNSDLTENAAQMKYSSNLLTNAISQFHLKSLAH